MISVARLTQLLSRFAEARIALVGDLYLDRYLELAPGVREVSIETGLEAFQIDRVRNSPGALGTVMNNLVALGARRLTPVTVIGDDGHGYDLLREVERLGVETEHILRDASRLTPTYTKPMRPVERRDGTALVELNRLDIRTRGPLSPDVRQQLVDRLARVFAECDGLIVCDQVVEDDWGVFGPALRDVVGSLAAERPERLVFVDSRAHMSHFDYGTLKPNRTECLAAIGAGADEDRGADEKLCEGIAAMSRRTGNPVFCTLAERGMLVAEPEKTPLYVPTRPPSGPIDVVGAGDSATAAIVASLLSGASPVEAAAVGNLVASITIEQLGTTGTATVEQTLQRARQWHPAA